MNQQLKKGAIQRVETSCSSGKDIHLLYIAVSFWCEKKYYGLPFNGKCINEQNIY